MPTKYLSLNLNHGFVQIEFPVFKRFSIKTGYSQLDMDLFRNYTSNYYLDVKYTPCKIKYKKVYFSVYFQNFDNIKWTRRIDYTQNIYYYNADYLGFYAGVRTKNFDFWLGAGYPVYVRRNQGFYIDLRNKKEIYRIRDGTEIRLKAGFAFCINFKKYIDKLPESTIYKSRK